MSPRAETRRPALGLALAAMLAAAHGGAGRAGTQDSVFFVSADGSNVAFDVRDVPRREVLSRLLTSQSVEFEWGDSAIGDERITGAFKGTVEAVLQRLLAQTDYVVTYSNEGPRPRIVRLVIIAKGGASSTAAVPQQAIPGRFSAPGTTPMITPAAPPPAGATAPIPFLTPPSPVAQPVQPAAPSATISPPLLPPSAPSPTR